ncbi:hypothetical protein BDV96DRAFT_651702 [Lophiotrema nucula]|uniref:Uncharacterized protein n=1 Tax=Lophiotrema nucula TaxID=690887 RepID=A0A6A5YRJ6_9PLEO|nr:hypothetical protein BDV96DRAFT_651702 [Lophiotrema nucula]
MQFTTLSLLSLAALAAALPASNEPRQTTVDPAQVPDFGITAGQDPVDGNCAGANGARIPCDCPPDRDSFISTLSADVAAGSAYGTPVTWSTDDSTDGQRARLQAAIVVLENLTGAGVGCPVSSTTYQAQLAALG